MNVESNPKLVRRMADEGHVIGHHTFDHSRLDRISLRETVNQIQRTDRLFERIIGRKVALFRPPRGRLTAAKMLRLWAAGMSIVLWSSDPKDCERQSAAELSAWFNVHRVQAGDVVLMHDDQPHAAQALPELVADAEGRGLEFTSPLSWISRS
jgi:peptidoglycan/xylan/chitin deacetylase (PgdA/CDA1 family)